MNSSIYLFGKLNQGYFQYPNDYTLSIFQNFSARATSKTQIIIHRQDTLMYYGYIRKLDNDESRYIGFCVLLNDLMIQNIKSLFSLFEEIFTNMVVQGEILCFDDNGNTITIDGNGTKQQEIERVMNLLRGNISLLEKDCVKLPPVQYGVDSSEIKTFAVADVEKKEVIDATYKYSYTYILKNEDYESRSFSNYKGVVQRLNKEKQDISSRFDKLNTEHKKILRQKKQTTLVAILCIAIIFFMIIGYGMISDKNVMISNREKMIRNKDNIINNKEKELGELSKRKNELEKQTMGKDKVIEIMEDTIKKRNQYINELIISNSYLKENVSKLEAELYSNNRKIERLNLDVLSLKRTVNELHKEINLKKEEISKLRAQNDVNMQKKSSKESIFVYEGAPMLSQPNTSAKIIKYVQGEVILLYKVNDNFYCVKNGNVEGYLWKEWVKLNY